MSTTVINAINHLISSGNPTDKGDRNNCFPVAVAVTTGIPYSDITYHLSHMGRRVGKGTPWSTISKYLPRMKFQIMKEYGTWYQRRTNPTVLQFAKSHPTGKYILIVKGHALAVVDGVIYDTLRTKRARIFQAWELKK